MHGFVDEKTDVFAFGVFLLEIISGKKPVDGSHQSLHSWVINFVLHQILITCNFQTPLKKLAFLEGLPGACNKICYISNVTCNYIGKTYIEPRGQCKVGGSKT